MLLVSCSSNRITDEGPREQGEITTPLDRNVVQTKESNAIDYRKEAPVITFGSASGQTLLEDKDSVSSPVPLPVEPLNVEKSFVPPLVKVALLVPLSGRNASLGQSMVNAAQLAVFDIAPEGFELLPRDTGINTVQAVQAAKSAIADGANFVIGPLFALNVAAVRPVMESASINMVALSTDTSLARPGAYVMGFAPAPQVERVVSYAVAQGYRQFAALLPDDPYGKLVGDTFKEALSRHGVSLVAMERLSNLAYMADKKESIEVLLLPFAEETLKKIVPQLEKMGFQQGKVQLLGTGLWDAESLGEDIPFLRGGWYATSEPEVREPFMAAYEQTYGKAPPRLVTLAYDATALAAVLTKTGRGFDRTALTNPVGFAGLDGVFRLRPEGQVERGLAITEITESGRRTIDPAPSSFSNR